MKRLGLVFGILGLIGCFLPFWLGASYWDFHTSVGGRHVYLVLAAFLAPVLATQGTRSTALLGIAGFGYVAWRVFGTDVFTVVQHGSIGAVLMVVGAYGGLVSSLSALAARE